MVSLVDIYNVKESYINRIEENKNLDAYKPSFSAKELINYIDSEFDIETLEIIQSKVNERVNYLNSLVGTAMRKPIKGFGK